MRNKQILSVCVALLCAPSIFAAETPKEQVALRGVSEDTLFSAYRKVVAAEHAGKVSSSKNEFSDNTRLKLELALAQERERSRTLQKENELFRSSYDVVKRSMESEHGLKTQIAALEEELRLRNKEISSLRRENTAFLERDETAVALRVQKYAEENERLAKTISELKDRSGKSTQEMVSAYERRIAMLEDNLDVLTGGTWKMLKKENGEDSPEMKSILDRLRKQKSETAEIALRIEALEKAYATADVADGSADLNGDKDRSMLYFRLGKAYVKSGEYQSGIEAFLESLRYGAAPAEAHYFLGLLYQYVSGDREKSAASLRKYLYLAPNGPYAAKADEMLAAVAGTGKK